MPTFVYKAKQGPGKTVEGELHAESHAAALHSLDGMGYSPVWVREKDERGRIATLRRSNIRYRDVTVFTRQLASLTKSGVPILRALLTIGSQTTHAGMRRVVQDLEAAIRDGRMLSEAMARHPRQFPELYIDMVRSGEWSGVLDTILFRLADAREQEEETRRTIQAAMAYPLLVLTVGVLTVFVLLAFFMPRVIELFQDYHDLPLPTRLLIGASHFFSAYKYWIVLVGVLLAAVLNRVFANERGRLVADALKLRLPLVRRFIRDSNLARFARTLALLIESGVAIDKALELSAATLHNRVMRAEIEEVRRKTVQQGMPFSSGLRGTRHFPAFVANMSAVGEEAGRLEEGLSEVASFYEKETTQLSRLATSLIEPLLILVVGGIVGLIVAAMLLPIFEIGRGVQ